MQGWGCIALAFGGERNWRGGVALGLLIVGQILAVCIVKTCIATFLQGIGVPSQHAHG